MKTNLKIKITNILSSIVPILGGLLGAWAGADQTSKAWRRFAIPTLIMGLAFLKTDSVLIITIMFMAFVLSKGYGIPGGGNSGSSLGRFWYNIFNGNHFLADVFTRGTIGIMIGISLLSIPLINQNWLVYGLGCLGIILVQSLISWRDLGTFILFGKMLTWSEAITWGVVTLMAVCMIQFKIL